MMLKNYKSLKLKLKWKQMKNQNRINLKWMMQTSIHTFKVKFKVKNYVRNWRFKYVNYFNVKNIVVLSWHLIAICNSFSLDLCLVLLESKCCLFAFFKTIWVKVNFIWFNDIVSSHVFVLNLSKIWFHTFWIVA